MFPSTTPETFHQSCGFVFEENLVREITWLSWRHRFRKTPFWKYFPSTRKQKSSVFKFLRCEERFRKARFSWRVSVEGRHNRWNKLKLRFQIPAVQCGASDFWERVYLLCWVVKPRIETHKFNRLFTPTTFKKSVTNDCFYVDFLSNNTIQLIKKELREATTQFKSYGC